MTTVPLQSIGKALGNKDHTTIMYGADKIAKEVVTNEATKALWISLSRRLILLNGFPQ